MLDLVAPPIVKQKQLSIAEFEQVLALPENQDRLLELIHGEVYEKMPTQTHGMIASKIHGELYIYTKLHNIPRLGIEVRYSPPDDDYNDRIPDLSLILDTSDPVVKEGAVPRMPDFAVEIKSPTDTYKLMREKAEFYLQHGCQLVWLVYPEKSMVEVFRPNSDSEFFLVGEVLEGNGILPDFRLPVADIFGGV